VTKLLVIDDEARFLRALAISLRARGYEVDTATSGEEGLEVAAHAHPDLVVLDLGLPGLAGIDVLRALRGWTSVPVIVLSARHDEQTKVDALDLGADDYVTKPFGMDELLARLRATLRRSVPGQDEPVIVTPDFTIDLGAKRVRNAAGDDVRLTPIEWGIVSTLVRNRGKLVTQRHLLQEVWGPQYETETEYLRVHLAAIRRKLEPTASRPRYFVTEAGMGYRFEWTDAIT
jgi:two-component system KDP operon response regulator KdpE